MVVKRQCSFCAREIEPGTGMMFIKRDGTVFNFCTSSCRKQQLNLGRVGHRFKWTRAHELKRAADRSSAQRGLTASTGTKAGRTRPGRRITAPVPASAPPAPPAVEAAPAAAPAAPKETPATTEATAPSPAPAAKPRRPRKKAETPTSE
ncbi:MAG: 50S ribosomal protein L24e [Thermoplasmata archaeon]